MQSHGGLAAREEVAALFDAWNAALATKNPETVASLYGHDAVLLPTVSNEVRAHAAPASSLQPLAACFTHTLVLPFMPAPLMPAAAAAAVVRFAPRALASWTTSPTS